MLLVNSARAGDLGARRPARSRRTARACFLHRILRGFQLIRAQGRATREVSSMFTLRVPDPFGCRGVSCVKLPAAVAFPIDSQLLDRLERSRRALPPNSVKPLLEESRAAGDGAAAAQRPLEVGVPIHAQERRRSRNDRRFPVSAESRLRQLVRAEPVYARRQVALGQS